MQAQGYCNNPLKYTGMVDVWQQAIRKEVGFLGFFDIHNDCILTSHQLREASALSVQASLLSAERYLWRCSERPSCLLKNTRIPLYKRARNIAY